MKTNLLRFLFIFVVFIFAPYLNAKEINIYSHRQPFLINPFLDLFSQGYFQREGNIYNNPGAPPSGMTATGGVISDYSDSGTVYRAHIFTSSGTFTVSDDTSDFGTDVEYLVVAGGGGGGYNFGGGGGAGGAGGAGSNVPSGTGGAALNISISGSPVTYAGGGGGGGYPAGGMPDSGPADPSAGSNASGHPPGSANGTANRGGGAGGYENAPDGSLGGAQGSGGSGVVIIAYPVG